MAYMVNLLVAGRPAVVIGGGKIAARKAEDLLAGGAAVTIVSPEVCGVIEGLAAAGRLRVHQRRYAAGDLDGAFLAIAATDDELLNAAVSRDAKDLGIIVNVVDRPALCTFTLPAVVRRGDLSIAISTEGKCPAFASVLREDLARQFGDEYAEVVVRLAQIRRDLMERGWDGERIRKAVQDLYHGGLADMVKTDDQEAWLALSHRVLGPASDSST